MNQVVALVETSKASSDAREGLALTPHEIHFNFDDLGQGSFQWSQLAGAFFHPEGLELAFRDNRRMMISQRHYLRATGVALEKMFLAASG